MNFYADRPCDLGWGAPSPIINAINDDPTHGILSSIDSMAGGKSQFILPKTGRVAKGLPVDVVPVSRCYIADGVATIHDEFAVVDATDDQMPGTFSDSQAT